MCSNTSSRCANPPPRVPPTDAPGARDPPPRPGGIVRGGHEQDGVGVPRTLRAPRRRERIRLEEDDVVRRLELRQPVRRRLASQRTNARLSNLRQPRRAVRHARHARLAQRREHGAAKFVQRQRRTLRDGNHRHRSRREGARAASPARAVVGWYVEGAPVVPPATVDSSRDVTPRELHPPSRDGPRSRSIRRRSNARPRATPTTRTRVGRWAPTRPILTRESTKPACREPRDTVRRVVRRRREETSGRGTRAAIERPMCSAIESSADAARGVFSEERPGRETRRWIRVRDARSGSPSRFLSATSQVVVRVVFGRDAETPRDDDVHAVRVGDDGSRDGEARARLRDERHSAPHRSHWRGREPSGGAGRCARDGRQSGRCCSRDELARSAATRRRRHRPTSPARSVTADRCPVRRNAPTDDPAPQRQTPRRDRRFGSHGRRRDARRLRAGGARSTAARPRRRTFSCGLGAFDLASAASRRRPAGSAHVVVRASVVTSLAAAVCHGGAARRLAPRSIASSSTVDPPRAAAPRRHERRCVVVGDVGRP